MLQRVLVCSSLEGCVLTVRGKVEEQLHLSAAGQQICGRPYLLLVSTRNDPIWKIRAFSDITLCRWITIARRFESTTTL